MRNIQLTWTDRHYGHSDTQPDTKDPNQTTDIQTYNHTDTNSDRHTLTHLNNVRK